VQEAVLEQSPFTTSRESTQQGYGQPKSRSRLCPRDRYDRVASCTTTSIPHAIFLVDVRDDHRLIVRRETRQTVGQGRALSGVGSCGPSYDRAPVELCLSFLIITHRQPYPGITSPWRTTNHSWQDVIGRNSVCCGFSGLAGTAWSASYVSLRGSPPGRAAGGRTEISLGAAPGGGRTDRPRCDQ